MSRAQPTHFDLRSDLHTEHQTLDIGPSHPATQGSVKFSVELDGESIAALDVELGYLHRGFEKECESGSWYQCLPYTDRLNYQSAAIANVGFCIAVEKLLGLETPLRCQWLRVLASELARAGDHLTRIASACRELSAMTPYVHAIEARELIWDLIEALCGARVTSSYVRIGGVRHAFPAGFAADWEAARARVDRLLGEVDSALTRNRMFSDRLRGRGILSRDDCIAYAVTGPLARAAGIEIDLRKQQPYLVYDEIDFDVPVGEVGDNYDRYLVCFEELRQSLRIVAQCVGRLDELGPGPVDVAEGHVRWPAKGRVFNRAEEMIQHFKGVTEGPRVPAGEVYFASESANGELGFYLVSDGSAKPCKVRCRPPSLFNLQPLEKMVRGALLSDLVPTFSLLNVVGGELDR